MNIDWDLIAVVAIGVAVAAVVGVAAVDYIISRKEKKKP